VLIIGIFTHREALTDALGAIMDGVRGRELFNKAVDCFGDWWAPVAVIPLTALVLSFF